MLLAPPLCLARAPLPLLTTTTTQRNTARAMEIFLKDVCESAAKLATARGAKTVSASHL